MKNVVNLKHSVYLPLPMDFHRAAHIMHKGDLGGFAEALASAWFRADPENRKKIQAVWPELFLRAFEIFEVRDKG